MSAKDEEAQGGDEIGAEPVRSAVPPAAAAAPRRRTMLEMAAEARRREEEIRAPARAAAREKAFRQAHEAREAGLEALMQLIMGHPGVRELVTPVDGKAAFELTQDEADELFRRDFKRQNRGSRRAHQRRKP